MSSFFHGLLFIKERGDFMLCSREVKTEMRGKAGANIPPGGLCAGRKKVILQNIPQHMPCGRSRSFAAPNMA